MGLGDVPIHDQQCIAHAVTCFVSVRGKKLCASSWLPAHASPKALLLLCHGYSLNCSDYWRGTAEALARQGYAVFGLDYEGHGWSEGTPALVPSLQLVAADCVDYFRGVRESPKLAGKPRFVCGESLGGAVAQLILEREPHEWAGAVLLAPLFQMPPALVPGPAALVALQALHRLFPAWALGPPVPLADGAIEDPEKREPFRRNALVYQGCFRLQSWMSLIEGAEDAQKIAHKVRAPLLVLHGKNDHVVGASEVNALMAAVGSPDKTMRAYPGMWHLLTEGGTPEHAAAVLKDMVAWLDDHCA